jgi:hypothetical protein
VVYRSLRPFALVILGLTMSLSSCGSDSTTTPGGGSAAKTFALSPGMYTLDASVVDCTTMAPIMGEHQIMPVCVSDPVTDLFGFACPVKQSGNKLSVSCDLSQEVTPGCTQMTKIRGTGTSSSSVTTLSGTIEFSDSPLGCADSTQCWAFDVTLTKTGAAPPGCTYADVGTIALTVTGGPLAGKHIMGAGGSGSDNGGGAISFNFSGLWPPQPPTAAAAAGELLTSISMNVGTPPISPQTLPVTLPATIVLGKASSSTAGGVDTALIGYYEASGATTFTATSVASGTVTINVLAVEQIAGRMSLVLDGTQNDNGTPSPSQRTISGGFFVYNSAQPSGANDRPARGIVSRALAEMMRQARP